MKLGLLAAAASAVLAFGVTAANATPLALTGNYIRVGISDFGTLGSNGNTSPGLLHDPTGTGNFGVNDYITPGTPHEGFAINSVETGFVQNDNTGAYTFVGAGPALTTFGSYDHAATWTGSNGSLEITNLYYFNDGDQRINVRTTLTAVTDLTDLAFARSVDPDPDVATFGSFATNNQRGNSLFGATDFVGSAGPATGLTLGLLNTNGNLYDHNTAIGFGCCSNNDPYSVLTGYNQGAFGDYSLNLAFLVGNLAAGSSAVLNYAYVVGDNIQDVGGGVPEPGAWALMILGFGAAGASLRRRRAVAA